jgi:hypothetical protein
VACDISLESSWWGLQLWFRPHFNSRSARKVMGPKIVRVPTLVISGLPFGSLGTKCHLDVGLMERHIVYYKGESGDFPQVRVVMSLVSSSCPWVVLAPKVFQLCINHLVLILCRSMWVNEVWQFFVVPSRSSSTPLYPSKVLRVRECAQFLILSLFFVWDSHLIPSRSRERIN